MTDETHDKSPTTTTFKLIAIDFDGTLLNPAGQVTDRTRAAVQRVISAGYKVCFATGRNWTESESVLTAVGHRDLAVFVGGAMVVDTVNRRLLHRTAMNSQLAADVCRFFESRGHAALALQDRTAADADYWISADQPLNTETERWMQVSKAITHRVSDLADRHHEHTIRVGIVAAPSQSQQMLADLRRDFVDRIVCHSLAVLDYGVEVLEVFDPAVNKWQGILHVAGHYGIDPAEIVAIGDEMNDVPMLKNAGLGIAMGNAKPPAKAAAKRVIGSNADDGLAIFLEELTGE